jgi:hypothetical protein
MIYLRLNLYGIVFDDLVSSREHTIYTWLDQLDDIDVCHMSFYYGKQSMNSQYSLTIFALNVRILFIFT